MLLRRHRLFLVLFSLLLSIHVLVPRSESQGSNHSVLFNGTSSYVDVPYNANLNITGALTMEAWVKTSANTYQMVLERGDWWQNQMSYDLTISEGKVRMDIMQSNGSYVACIGNTLMNNGAWHHIAGVYDGSQMRVYLDGVLNGSATATMAPGNNSTGLRIGKSSFLYYPNYFNGRIDEVRVSNAALYSSNFTPGAHLTATSSTKGLWKVDGQTANDSSGSGAHGSLQGSAQYSTDVPTGPNNAPVITLNDPQNNTNFAAGSNVVIDASASDSDGNVAKVEFFQGTTLLSADLTAPYTFVWTNVAAGSYAISARATDDLGATTNTTPITITVNQAGGERSVLLNGTSSYVDVPYNANLNITGALTMEAWVKTSANTYQMVLERGDWWQNQMSYDFAIADGKVRMDIMQSNGTYVSCIGSTLMNNGAWHHIAGVYDGSQMRVYLDGVLNGSATATMSPGNNSTGLRIGKSSFLYYPNYFNGRIDEVRVSNAALYSSNFTPNAHLTATSSTKGLWKFDGETTNDASASGASGSLQGGATYSTDVPTSGGTQVPVAMANGPYTALPGQAIAFSNSGSFDPDGAITSYHWNFGDGTSANTSNPSHTYQTSGVFTATLTVTDNSGLRASATAAVTISGATEARLDPRNQTGGDGENPLSQNFNWNLPLLSLPGRAGMDLGLMLSYNSLVWTKNASGNYVTFDDDRGFPSPGFRLGFPMIQPIYFNSEVGKYAFLLIGPDGSRTELRQVGTSGLYEAADSSHLLLDTATMTLFTSDGTQLSYVWMNGEYNCTQIKDRNGNYITINYTPFGRIDTVIDTLARSIKFNYDTSGLLTSITQVWNQDSPSELTHNWAVFTYGDTFIQTNFSLTVYGPPNNSNLKTLSKVTLADGSHTDFSYTSWGQVWKVSNFAPNNDLLNYRAYKLPGSPLLATSAQDDCPRFTQRRDWAKYSNGDTNGDPDATPSTEDAITSFAGPVNDSWTMPDGIAATGKRVEITSPDGTVNKIYFIGTPSNSAWSRGLPALVVTYTGEVWQRKVMTTWTQDNTAVSYPLNPRVTETNIYDPSENRARTRIAYQHHNLPNGTSCDLPKDVLEYAGDATTIVRSTRTTYNMSSDYTDAHILGLVSVKSLYAGEVDNGGTLMSKLAFFYDGDDSIEVTDELVQHDDNHYDATVVAGRGNLTSIRRYDVTTTTTEVFTTTSSTYNTAGSLVSSTDAAGHSVKISYADSFSDGIARTTLAYPTEITDPDEYTSTSKYNFDFGAVTRTQAPPTNTTDRQDHTGPEQSSTFDSIGRLQQVTNLVNKAYTRFEYSSGAIRVDTYTTVQEGLGEAHSFKISDGAGRVIAIATDHNANTFSGQKIVYDVMGRVIKTSNPTETSASGSPSQWNTTGDDQTRGWIYTEQTYDWKGRPLVITYPSMTSNPAETTTKQFSYSGCGCAGGQVVTVTDEGTLQADGSVKKRQQKIYADVLGRTVKTEILNWDGTGPNGTNGTPYSTIVNTYNVRDQIEQIRHYAGAAGSGTFQNTALTYDGYGRLSAKHVPQQTEGTKTDFTYNDDDTISTVTDARNAVSTYSYNKRHLVTGITYSAPAGITPASNLVFAYDAAANRTSMTDGAGTTSYNYDELSRLMSETRVFTNVGTFTLAYDYNLAGQLKKITDASNTTINYGYDRVGRLTGVTGSDTLVGGVSTYASGFQYRAWGALKQVAIGTHTSSFSYNSGLRPTNFNISGGVANQNYEYYSDGHLSFVHNTTDNNFDRAFSYDHVGRLTLAVSGGAARNDTGSIPMYETFIHDTFDNVTDRETDTWSDSYSDGASYTNHRRAGWGYDANGNVTTIDSRTYSYNAAGLLTALGGQQWTPNGYVTTTSASGFDGNGQKVREESPTGSGFITYYLRSTVLGGAILEELNSSGQKQIGYVYTPSGNALATQVPGQNEVRLKQVSPIGQSQYEFYTSDGSTGRQEFDPLGADIRLHSGPPRHGGAAGDINEFGPMGSRSGAIDNPAAGCTLDGVWVPCSMAFRLLGQGAAEQCPANDCGPQARWVVTDEGKKVPFLTLPFMAFANGESGYYIPGWSGLTPQAQADAAPYLRALAAGNATGWSIDSSFTPKTVDWSVLQNSLKTCIPKLWEMFEMTSFTATSAPELKAKNHDQFNGVVGLRDVRSGSNFEVVNDPTPPTDVRADIIKHESRGSTDILHPFWNYAYPAGDLKPRAGELRYPELFGQAEMTYVRVQIHELGASLSAIRNIYHPAMWARRLPDRNLDPEHEDDGPSLEECVGRDYYQQMGLTPH